MLFRINLNNLACKSRENMGPFEIAMFYSGKVHNLGNWKTIKRDLVLSLDIKNWLEEQNVEWHWDLDNERMVCIDIQDLDAAMLFKLTWM